MYNYYTRIYACVLYTFTRAVQRMKVTCFLQLQMTKLESKQEVVAGTMSPKQKRVRSKSRSSGERCMSDQSDTDMDTSTRSDHFRSTTPMPMVVDKAHSETADGTSAACKSWLIYTLSLSLVCFIVLSADVAWCI